MVGDFYVHLQRNPKMELSKTDLLKLLGYLEGELQARDIVIAALKVNSQNTIVIERVFFACLMHLCKLF